MRGFQPKTYSSPPTHTPTLAVRCDLSLLYPSLFSSAVCSVSRPVDGRLCDGNEPPLAVQSCSVPCQHHCVFSQWSSWGPCIHENCKEPQGKKGKTACSRSEKENNLQLSSLLQKHLWGFFAGFMVQQCVGGSYLKWHHLKVFIEKRSCQVNIKSGFSLGKEKPYMLAYWKPRLESIKSGQYDS